jgi:hypothetical protein
MTENSAYDLKDVLDELKKKPLVDILKSPPYNVKFTTATYAHCPFHEDERPSFSVFGGNGRFWRWKCHSAKHTGQNSGTYIDFRALWEKKTPDEVMQEIAAEHGLPAQRTIIGNYVYRDEDGTPLYQKQKSNSKSARFKYEWFEDGKPKPGLPPRIKKVPYNLPELIGSSTVIILEGEKDCNNVAALGFTTTTAGGVNDWRPDFAGYFRNKEVFICMDVRQEETAGKIARDISGVAASIKILNLRQFKPSLTEREQDITDWLDTLGGILPEEKRARLSSEMARASAYSSQDDIERAALKEAPETAQPAEGCMAISITNADEIKRLSGSRDIFMEYWLARNEITILGGDTKVGKTTLAMNAALCLASGQDFLGFRVPSQRNVLLVQQELSRGQIDERLRKMFNGKKYPGFSIRPSKEEPFDLTNPDHKTLLFKLIDKQGPDLLILDSWPCFHKRDGRDEVQMNLVMDTLSEICQTRPVGILIMQIYSKPTREKLRSIYRLYGPQIVYAKADSIVCLNKKRDPYRELEFELRGAAANPENMKIEMDMANNWYRLAQEYSPFGQKVRIEDVKKLVKKHGGTVLESELIKELIAIHMISRPTALKAIRKASPFLDIKSLPKPGSPHLIRLKDGNHEV